MKKEIGLVLAASALTFCGGEEKKQPEIYSPPTALNVLNLASQYDFGNYMIPDEKPTPEPEPLLKEERIRPLIFSIPDVGIIAEIVRGSEFDEKKSTYLTPDYGVATNSNNPDYFKNKIFMFGHSYWKDEPGVFNKLKDVELEDKLLVRGVDKVTGDQTGVREYEVEKIAVVDEKYANEILFGDEIPENPKALLLTTMREKGVSGYKFDMEVISQKAEILVDGNIEDINKGLWLLIIADLKAKS